MHIMYVSVHFNHAKIEYYNMCLLFQFVLNIMYGYSSILSIKHIYLK